MGTEQEHFFDPTKKVDGKVKTTTEEDLKHLAKLGEKALEQKNEALPEQMPPTEIKLGKAFQVTADEAALNAQQQEEPKENEKNKRSIPEIKLGKAFK